MSPPPPEEQATEDYYLEHWQRKQIKGHDFYEEEAKRRHYFYTVDLQGRLFLEESKVKNITSCLKDNRFLDFFFSRIRRNETGFHPTYPFISPCGKELNFILPADSPIVFHDLLTTDPGVELVYGGTKRVPFDPTALRLSRRTHRLYHELGPQAFPRFGLLRSHLCLMLSDRIVVEEDDSVYFRRGKQLVPLYALPDEEEPTWGMQTTADTEEK